MARKKTMGSLLIFFIVLLVIIFVISKLGINVITIGKAQASLSDVIVVSGAAVMGGAYGAVLGAVIYVINILVAGSFSFTVTFILELLCYALFGFTAGFFVSYFRKKRINYFLGLFLSSLIAYAVYGIVSSFISSSFSFDGIIGYIEDNVLTFGFVISVLLAAALSALLIKICSLLKIKW